MTGRNLHRNTGANHQGRCRLVQVLGFERVQVKPRRTFGLAAGNDGFWVGLFEFEDLHDFVGSESVSGGPLGGPARLHDTGHMTHYTFARRPPMFVTEYDAAV